MTTDPCTINLNDTVTVILTGNGAKILNDIADDFVKRHPKCKSSQPPHKAGDRYRTQLWCLMQEFGPHTNLGNDAHFEGLDIYMTTAPFRILSPGPHLTRDGRRVEVKYDNIHPFGLTHPWKGDDGVSRTDHGAAGLAGFEHGRDLIARAPAEESPARLAPSRLERAKAALASVRRSCEANWNTDQQRIGAAEHEVYLAEQEAAAIAALPPALVEVAREIVQDRDNYGVNHYCPDGVLQRLAKAHGVTVDALRLALEVKP